MSHSMTKTERQEFLAGLHIGVLGIRTDDGSLTVPIWYDYEHGGDLWVITAPGSLKGRSLEATRRFSLCAQDEAPPYKYVTVEGEVTAIDPCSEEPHRRMARRYLGEEFGDVYHEANATSLSEQRIYRLTPTRWYTVDYAKDFV